MRPAQIEAWALQVAERIAQGRPHEDSRVELKAEWPTDHRRAARQMAGLANASRGSPVMWLIGLDQTRGIVGAKHQELSSWLPQIERCFDGVAPPVLDLNVPTAEGSEIVALYIETERAPFVVTTDTSPEREVPWRTGTMTRSAHRSELLLMLSQAVLVPDVEVLSLSLAASTPDGKIEDTESTELRWNLAARLYITPQDDRRITIPVHRCIASAEVGDLHLQLEPFFPGQGDRPNVEATVSEIVLSGPASISVFFNGRGPMKPQTQLPDTAHVTVDLGVAGAIRPASFSEELERREAEAQQFQFARWSNRPDWSAPHQFAVKAGNA